LAGIGASPELSPFKLLCAKAAVAQIRTTPQIPTGYSRDNVNFAADMIRTVAKLIATRARRSKIDCTLEAPEKAKADATIHLNAATPSQSMRYFLMLKRLTLPDQVKIA